MDSSTLDYNSCAILLGQLVQLSFARLSSRWLKSVGMFRMNWGVSFGEGAQLLLPSCVLLFYLQLRYVARTCLQRDTRRQVREVVNEMWWVKGYLDWNSQSHVTEVNVTKMFDLLDDYRNIRQANVVMYVYYLQLK